MDNLKSYIEKSRDYYNKQLILAEEKYNTLINDNDPYVVKLVNLIIENSDVQHHLNTDANYECTNPKHNFSKLIGQIYGLIHYDIYDDGGLAVDVKKYNDIDELLKLSYKYELSNMLSNRKMNDGDIKRYEFLKEKYPGEYITAPIFTKFNENGEYFNGDGDSAREIYFKLSLILRKKKIEEIKRKKKKEKYFGQ